MKIYSENLRVPIKCWCLNPEQSAIEQAQNLANLPFAFHHVALMPDTHLGFGMPIGGVLATEKVIIPNAVGVDIGCGMCATKTTLHESELNREVLTRVMSKIREVVPVGFAHQKEPQNESLMPYIVDGYKGRPVCLEQYPSAIKQLGTLGGGNHFIEIQKDKDGMIWVMLHSGSRNLGKKVADHYNKLAVDLNEKYHSAVPKVWQLAFLPIDSREGQEYIAEMRYCVEFALANRSLMMNRILFALSEVVAGSGTKGEKESFFQPWINIAHNYASLEHHYGRDVWVHRKGATLARSDTIGIIPGSQGTASYIVLGKGCADSFQSCSHGAGRKMGRKEACRKLDLEEEKKKLEGIVHSVRNTTDLDEAPGAYKSIDTVMAEQTDLVDIIVELKPLAVIKG